MDVLLQDVRFAVRTLLRAPLVSALAIVCLALDIGANTTMFQRLRRDSHQALPFKDVDRLVVLTETNQPNGIDDDGMSYLNFRDCATRRARSPTSQR